MFLQPPHAKSILWHGQELATIATHALCTPVPHTVSGPEMLNESGYCNQYYLHYRKHDPMTDIITSNATASF